MSSYFRTFLLFMHVEENKQKVTCTMDKLRLKFISMRKLYDFRVDFCRL